jgi:hypothetical protein
MPQTRREYLRAGSAAVGTGALLGLSGCLDAVPFVGGGASYRQWMHEPGEMREDGDDYFFTMQKPSQLANNQDSFDGDYYDDNIESDYTPVDVDFEDVTREISFSNVSVLVGSFDTSDVADALEDEDNGEYEEDSTYNGWTLYLQADGSSLTDGYALKDGGFLGSPTVVNASGTAEVDADEALELVADTKSGSGSRYVNAEDDANLLTNRLGDATYVYGSLSEETDTDDPENGQFENSTGFGLRQQVNGGTTNVKYLVLYDSQGDVDTGDLEDWVDANEDDGDTFDDIDDVSVNQNGRVGVVSGSLPTDDIGQ